MPNKHEARTGADFFCDYVRLFFPDAGGAHADATEFDRVSKLIATSVSELFSTLSIILSASTLEDRLSDLARHNPLTAGNGIPIIYVPQPLHSHNMNVGIPYTGVYAGKFPDLDTIVPHEMTHIVTGKFNDAITEPIASLFIKDRRYGSRRRRRIPLNINQLISLAVLELFSDGARLADLGSLQDMFSHRPQNRIITCLRYQYDRQYAADGEHPAELTQQFLTTHLRASYHEDFRDYTALGLNPPQDQDEQQLNQWLEKHAQPAFEAQRRNPNESRGVVRSFHGFLDNNLMDYLLVRGLDGKAYDSCTPEEARESVRRLLEFYYAPIESLQLYGLASFDELQSTMLGEYQERFKRLPFHNQNPEFMTDWLQLKDDLRESPCYQPETWGNQDCLAMGAGVAVENFINKYFRGPGPGPNGPPPKDARQSPNEPPPKAFHPLVKKSLQVSDGQPLISLTEKLGQDLDFDRYCALP